MAPYFARFGEESAAARTRLSAGLDRRYGPHERELVDLFPAPRASAPLFVFVHGGYWRRMSKNEFSFVAAPFVAAGCAVAILNYPLAPAATLDDIVDAVRRGFAYVLARTEELNADSSRVVVGGHSVGAQLAASIAAVSPVRGLVGLSGLYDLRPLRRTHVNDTIAMDEATARRHSPIETRPLGSPFVTTAYGGLEQQAFGDQQRGYAEHALKWGCDVREIAAPEHNHFTIVLALGDASSSLGREIVRQVVAIS